MIQPSTPGGLLTLISLNKSGSTSLTVPANQRFEILWLSVTYVCNANVVTRYIKYVLTRVDTNTVSLGIMSLTASQTGTFTLGITGATPATIDAGAFVFAQGIVGVQLMLYAGQSLGVVIGSGDAGDTWAAEGVSRILPLQCP